MVRVAINYLSKEELLYEVSVRDVDSSGSVVELRSLLAKFLQIEKRNPSAIEEYPEYPFTDEEDTKAIGIGLGELNTMLGAFVGKDTRRVESKLWHLMGRVRRMDESSENRKDLLKQILDMKER